MNFERTLIQKMTYSEPSLPNLPIFTTQSMLTLNSKKKLLPFLRLLDKALYIVRFCLGANLHPISTQEHFWSLDLSWRLLRCSTGGCLTIQIEQVMFDNPQKLGCLTRIMFDVEQQLSNKTLIEHNFCPRLCSINVYFD